jgi:hypothetical protein
MEKAVETVVDTSTAASMKDRVNAAVRGEGIAPGYEPVQLKGRPPTLAEQVQQIDRARQLISDKLRREGVDARCDVERRIGEANAQYARALAEETARLERERDEAIRIATEDYHNRLNELAALLRRHP